METTLNRKPIAKQRSPDGVIDIKLGKTVYTFNLFFSATSTDTLEDRIKKLISREVKYGNAFR